MVVYCVVLCCALLLCSVGRRCEVLCRVVLNDFAVCCTVLCVGWGCTSAMFHYVGWYCIVLHSHAESNDDCLPISRPQKNYQQKKHTHVPGLSPKSAYLLNMAAMERKLGPFELLRPNLDCFIGHRDAAEQATNRVTMSVLVVVTGYSQRFQQSNARWVRLQSPNRSHNSNRSIQIMYR